MKAHKESYDICTSRVFQYLNRSLLHPNPAQGHAPPALSKGKPARFVHPKVSMAVGDKVGVGSLRRSMVNQSLAQLDFGIAVPGESFGQQESLTRRLKHILQMYPEGPRSEAFPMLAEALREGAYRDLV